MRRICFVACLIPFLLAGCGHDFISVFGVNPGSRCNGVNGEAEALTRLPPFNTTILTADGLLVKHRGFVGWCITRVTGGDVSHAMTAVTERHVRAARDAGWLVVRQEHETILDRIPDAERIWCVSADGDGLWASPLEQWVHEGYEIRVRRVPDTYAGQPINVPVGWQDRAGDLAARVCGLWGYSFRYLFTNVGYALVGPPKTDPADIDAMTDERLERTYHRYMCSQTHSLFVRRCAGWDPCVEADRATTPNALDKTDRLVTTCDRVAFVSPPRAFPRGHRRPRWMPRW